MSFDVEICRECNSVLEYEEIVVVRTKHGLEGYYCPHCDSRIGEYARRREFARNIKKAIGCLDDVAAIRRFRRTGRKVGGSGRWDYLEAVRLINLSRRALKCARLYGSPFTR